MMVVDLIANNDWSRPIYFSVTVGNNSKSYFWLDDYFRLEGLAYRFVPVSNPTPKGSVDFGVVDADIMYTNMMEKFSYGNMGVPGVYLDETNRRVSYNLRNCFGRMAVKFAEDGENEKAIEVLDYCMEVMPEEKFQFNYFIFAVIEGYFKAGASDKADELVQLFAKRLDEELGYYQNFRGERRKNINNEIQAAVQYYQMLLRLDQQYHGTGQNLQQSELYQRYQQAVQPFGMG